MHLLHKQSRSTQVISKLWVEAPVKGGQPWVFEITSPTREPRNTSRPMLDNNKSPYWAFVDETECPVPASHRGNGPLYSDINWEDLDM